MQSVGIMTPPDVYTASIGFYLLWMLGRMASSFIPSCTRGNLHTLMNHVAFWIKQVLCILLLCIFLHV